MKLQKCVHGLKKSDERVSIGIPPYQLKQMATNIINGHELQAHLFSVQEKKKLAQSEQAYVSYGGKPGKFYIQTPVMRLPFGISPPNPDKQIMKYSAQLSFDGMDKDPKIRAFYDALVALDEHMIDLGVQNSVAWFGGKKSRDVVMEKYQPILKPSKKAEYAPTFKLQVREIYKAYKTVGGKREPDLDAGKKLEPVLYDLDDNRLDYGDFDICDAVPRGSLAKVRIEVGSVWFSSLGYGLTLRFSMARVKPSAVVQGPPPGDKEEFTSAESYAPAPHAEEGEMAEGEPEGETEPVKHAGKGPVKPVAKKAVARTPTPPPEEEASEETPEDEEPPAPVVTKKPVAKVVKKAK